jgi:hypothetical protein
LSCGGNAGFGQRYTAVPFDRLTVRLDDGKWTAGLDVCFAPSGQQERGVANYIPIPWARFGLTYNREDAAVTVTIDDTKEHLERAAIVKGDNYETMLAPGFADEVRHDFGVTGRGTGTDVKPEHH